MSEPHPDTEPTLQELAELAELADTLSRWQEQEMAELALRQGHTPQPQPTPKRDDMKMRDAFPSKWLRGEDLLGKSHLVKIDRVTQEEIGSGSDSEMKMVAWFAGKQKGVILNKTNASAIAAKYGDESDDWAGAEVELYPEMVTFQGKTAPAIRIRVPVMAASPDEEIPF